MWHCSYDLDVGERFLQTDPIGYKDDYDLYTYVGNDPLNKTDPTGMVIEVHANAENMEQYNNAVNYLKADEGFRADYAQLQSSSTTYNIYVSDTNKETLYNPDTTNTSFKPHEGMTTDEGTQSPAMGLRHELDHAAQHDKTGEAIKRNPDGTSNARSRREENRATRNETRSARNLHEPARRTYNEGRATRVPDSTSSCKKTRTNPCN